jgi:hypothetical protein
VSPWRGREGQKWAGDRKQGSGNCFLVGVLGKVFPAQTLLPVRVEHYRIQDTLFFIDILI